MNEREDLAVVQVSGPWVRFKTYSRKLHRHPLPPSAEYVAIDKDDYQTTTEPAEPQMKGRLASTLGSSFVQTVLHTQ